MISELSFFFIQRHSFLFLFLTKCTHSLVAFLAFLFERTLSYLPCDSTHLSCYYHPSKGNKISCRIYDSFAEVFAGTSASPDGEVRPQHIKVRLDLSLTPFSNSQLVLFRLSHLHLFHKYP
jgi:hypothetical protein